MPPSRNHKIRVLLFEDNRLIRKGISALLEDRKDILLLGAPGIHDGTIALIRRLKPDVILLDVSLLGHDSLHMVETISRDLPKAAVIVMDLAPDGRDILQFIKAGACGFVLKDASPGEFLRTLATVASGGKVLPPLLSGSVFSEIVDHAIRGGGKGVNTALRITKREREVLNLISDGLTNKQISVQLRITAYTVKSHVHNIMEKLTLHTRLEVANYSLSRGTIARKV
jgi:two-component system nitrate/nitrite response regulator NarL